MSKISLQIIMRDASNNTIKENIGYVNSSATDAQLYELATKFSALTTNTFVRVNKIVTTQLEKEEE